MTQPKSPSPARFLHVYKTNVGIFVKNPLASYVIGGKTVTEYAEINRGYNNRFFRLPPDVDLTAIQEKRTVVTDNGWELVDPTIACEKIPLRLEKESFAWDEDADDWVCTKNPSLTALYKRDTVRETIVEPTDVEIVVLGEYVIDDEFDLTKRKVQVTATSEVELLPPVESVLTFDELELLLTPEFLRHKVACTLSSKQMYNIVRQFVKQNIDTTCAKISSDYDFCFEVKRIIHAPSKSDVKLEQIFEMTWAGYKGRGGYEKYTCIPSLSAPSLQKLYDKLADYLQNLMHHINQKAVLCEHCNGVGAIINKWKHK